MAERERLIDLESEKLGSGVPAATCRLCDPGRIPFPLWAPVSATSKNRLSLSSLLTLTLFPFSMYLSVTFPGKCQTFHRASVYVCQTSFVTPQLVSSPFMSLGFSTVYAFSNFSSYISLFALGECCRNWALFF